MSQHSSYQSMIKIIQVQDIFWKKENRIQNFKSLNIIKIKFTTYVKLFILEYIDYL
jgi:hypothetical protein